jgi:hypothetical protein
MFDWLYQLERMRKTGDDPLSQLQKIRTVCGAQWSTRGAWRKFISCHG